MKAIIERRKPGLYRLRDAENRFVGKITCEGPNSWVYDDYQSNSTRRFARYRDAKRAAGA